MRLCAVSWAIRPIFSRSCCDLRKFVIASSNATPSCSSHRIAPRPSGVASGIPPTRNATTGIPQAIASTRVSPYVSIKEAVTKTSAAVKSRARLYRSRMLPAKRTFKRSGTGRKPSPNARTITFSSSGKRDNCFNSHGTFLFVSFREAPPVTITNASAGRPSCFLRSSLSCGLKIVRSIPGEITPTPPHALAIALRPASSASQRLFATMRAPEVR